MRLEQARNIAERIRGELAPFCERAEIAGSIRRKKPEVKDIELVVIPKRNGAGLFDSIEEVNPEFCRLVNRWQAVKGKPAGKYTQRILPEGINLDLFIAERGNWGLIFAIRTGSASFSHKVLASGWVKNGYRSEGGYLRRENGTFVCCAEESDLFLFSGVPWTEPEARL